MISLREMLEYIVNHELWDGTRDPSELVKLVGEGGVVELYLELENRTDEEHAPW